MRSLAAASSSQFLEFVLRVGFFAVVVVSVVPFGAVHPFFSDLSTLMTGIVLAATLAIPFRNAELENLFRKTLLILALFSAYVVFQAVFFEGNPFAHSIWKTVEELLGQKGGSISVDPDATLRTLPIFLMPFLMFMAGLVLFQDDRSALQLWRWLAIFGVLIAGFGLFQFLVFPGSLLFGEKKYYLDSLTTVFINRNNAATFLGLSTLALGGLLVRQWQRLPENGFWRRLFNMKLSTKDPYFVLLMHVAAIFLVLVALFLTRSRAGIAASFAALTVASVVIGYMAVRRRWSPVSRFGFSIAIALAIVALFSVFASRALFRFEKQGVEDARWCAFGSIRQAIADHPWFGTGLGTFEQVFPVYRSPECGIYGIWDRAHNSYLEGYLDLGFPFALFLTVVGFLLLRALWYGYRSRRRNRYIPVLAGSMVLLVALHALVDFSLQIPGIANFFSALCVAAVSVSLGRHATAR